MYQNAVKKIEAIIKPRIDCYTDFKPGVNFMDIQSILGDPELNKLTHIALEIMLPRVSKDFAFDAVVCFDARGFFYGNYIASLAKVPCIMARKPGKLPGDLHVKKYTKEYGEDSIGIQRKRIIPGLRYMIHDDLLATGGTSDAASEIVTDLGGLIAGYNYLMEIDGLGGRKLLEKYTTTDNIRSLIHL